MIWIYPVVTVIGITVSIVSALKRSPFFNFLGILIAIYGFLMSLGLFMPPLPGQVVVMYMAMAIFAFLIFFSIQEDTWKAFLRPIKSVLAEEEKKAPEDSYCLYRDPCPWRDDYIFQGEAQI